MSQTLRTSTANAEGGPAALGAPGYLRVSGLVREFAGAKGVHGISFDVAEGEFVSLLGSSGCGKTTTLRMLSGVETPNAGEILVDGKPMWSGNNRVDLPPEKRDVGVVFQSYALWPHMSVRKNVAYPLTARKVPRSEVAAKVTEMLELVGLSEHADKAPGQLSGGQQQRVALARALVYKPKLLLLDEPLSNLDAALRESMRRDIRRIQRRLGITAIYVTHDRVEAMTMSDRIIVMSDGHIDQIGTPRQLFEQPESATVASLLTSASLIRGRIVGASASTAGDAVTVESGEGDSALHLKARAAVALPEGASVAVCLRPRDVQIVTGAATAAEFSGVVVDAYSTGGEYEYVVDVAGRIVKAVAVDEVVGVHVGDTVRIRYDEDRALAVGERM